MRLDYKKVVHFIFPPSDDEQLLLQTTQADFLAKYQRTVTTTHESLLPYQDPTVRAAVHLNKFHHHSAAQKFLAAVLQQYLSELDKPVHILVIPLSKKRQRARGYNQVWEVVKRATTAKSPHALHKNVLVRTRDTPPQTTLNKPARKKNLAGAFSLKTSSSLQGQHIVIIDDVYTTGATLAAAKTAVLTAKPATVTCIALAH
jgi:ComF family protein